MNHDGHEPDELTQLWDQLRAAFALSPQRPAESTYMETRDNDWFTFFPAATGRSVTGKLTGYGLGADATKRSLVVDWRGVLYMRITEPGAKWLVDNGIMHENQYDTLATKADCPDMPVELARDHIEGGHGYSQSTSADGTVTVTPQPPNAQEYP